MVQISQSGINTLFAFPMGENAERMQIVQESLEKDVGNLFDWTFDQNCSLWFNYSGRSIVTCKRRRRQLFVVPTQTLSGRKLVLEP